MKSTPADSIVRVTSSRAESDDFGTGFVFHLDADGAYVLTCAHVLMDVGGKDQQVKVGGLPAKVVAVGERNELDLAVLHVPGFTHKRPLTLRPDGQLGREVAVAGCFKYDKYRAVGRLTGKLSGQFDIEINDRAGRTSAWRFEISGPGKLQQGYSGSPVLYAENSDTVLGVVITKEGDRQGAAISIDALRELWEEMPAGLLTVSSEQPSDTLATSIEGLPMQESETKEQSGDERKHYPAHRAGVWTVPPRRATIARSEQYRAHFIGKAWNGIFGRLSDKGSSLAFTGMYGVGKTVLLDHLEGKGFGPFYQPPPESITLEDDYVDPSSVPSGRRIRIRVIPGQSERRVNENSMRAVFLGDIPVDGFVHVVANGFVTLRGEASRQTVLSLGNDTLASYREYHLERELEDLRNTLAVVRESIDRHQGKPSWMIIACAKVDLYAESDRLREAEDYYSPYGRSDFTKEIRALQNEVGSRNFAWSALPVCTWLEDFEWNGTRIESSLITGQRNKMVLDFIRALNEYSENDR